MDGVNGMDGMDGMDTQLYELIIRLHAPASVWHTPAVAFHKLAFNCIVRSFLLLSRPPVLKEAIAVWHTKVFLETHFFHPAMSSSALPRKEAPQQHGNPQTRQIKFQNRWEAT